MDLNLLNILTGKAQQIPMPKLRTYTIKRTRILSGETVNQRGRDLCLPLSSLIEFHSLSINTEPSRKAGRRGAKLSAAEVDAAAELTQHATATNQ